MDLENEMRLMNERYRHEHYRFLKQVDGEEKNTIRYTVVLAYCADCTKMPSMIIFKRETQLDEKIPADLVMHLHVGLMKMA